MFTAFCDAVNDGVCLDHGGENVYTHRQIDVGAPRKRPWKCNNRKKYTQPTNQKIGARYIFWVY